MSALGKTPEDIDTLRTYQIVGPDAEGNYQCTLKLFDRVRFFVPDLKGKILERPEHFLRIPSSSSRQGACHPHGRLRRREGIRTTNLRSAMADKKDRCLSVLVFVKVVILVFESLHPLN